MNILLVKTSSMGDILHTLPALTDAKKIYPDLRVDWVVEENFAQIPSWHNAVEHVLPVALRRWRKNWFTQSIKQERTQFLTQLKQKQYDCVIDAQGLIKSAFLITRHAQGEKHGYTWKSAREGLASFCYDVTHPVTWKQHAVERIRSLFAQSLEYEKPTNFGDYAIAEHFSAQNISRDLTSSNPYLVFLHSTTRNDKHWPEEHWIELIDMLTDTGITIKLPWGTEAEKARAERLASKFYFVEVLPKLTLAEVANQLANAIAVVSVDTGLSHLTAALSKPNMTLFGPTDPVLIGGYGQHQYSLISPTKNLIDLTPKSVFEHLTTTLIK